jgi:ATP-dependent Clp protease ATP-binding subunit ClpA
LGPFPTGEIEILGKRPRFEFEQCRIDEFIGRQTDMHRLIQCVTQNRLTTLKGIPGIGKTTISKQLGSLLAEREVFQDGIIYLSV